MIHTDQIRPNILRAIASTLGWVGGEEDEVSPEVLAQIQAFNAFQALDAYLNALGVVGKTGDFIEAVDELRSAEYPEEFVEETPPE